MSCDASIHARRVKSAKRAGLAPGPDYRIELLRCSIRRLTYMPTADGVRTSLRYKGIMNHAAGAGSSAPVPFFAAHTAAILLIRPVRRADRISVYGPGSHIREEISIR